MLLRFSKFSMLGCCRAIRIGNLSAHPSSTTNDDRPRFEGRSSFHEGDFGPSMCRTSLFRTAEDSCNVAACPCDLQALFSAYDYHVTTFDPGAAVGDERVTARDVCLAWN